MQDLNQMTNVELKRYISQHRNNDEAFRAALQVLIRRRPLNAPRHPYPFDLADPKSEVEAILRKVIEQND